MKYVCVKVTQMCLTLCDPKGYNPPGSSVNGILQAGILKWDLPYPGIKPRSPALQAESLSFEPPGEALYYLNLNFLKVKFSNHFFFLIFIQCLVSLSQKWDFQWLLSGFNSALGLNQEAYVNTIKKTSFGQDTNDQNFINWLFPNFTCIKKLKVHYESFPKHFS